MRISWIFLDTSGGWYFLCKLTRVTNWLYYYLAVFWKLLKTSSMAIGTFGSCNYDRTYFFTQAIGTRVRGPDTPKVPKGKIELLLIHKVWKVAVIMGFMVELPPSPGHSEHRAHNSQSKFIREFLSSTTTVKSDLWFQVPSYILNREDTIQDSACPEPSALWCLSSQ